MPRNGNAACIAATDAWYDDWSSFASRFSRCQKNACRWYSQALRYRPRAATCWPAFAASSARPTSSVANVDQVFHQLSRSPDVISEAITRHSPMFAMPESALPTERCS
jgi:hypothetical protein